LPAAPLRVTFPQPDPCDLNRSGLNDGREFSVVKVFYEPEILERRLIDLGWRGYVRASGRFFLYGSMTAD